MPASRNPEALCNLDDLPRPNLSIADLEYIQLMSKQYGRVEKPTVPKDDTITNKICSETSESNSWSGSKPVVTKSNAEASSNISKTSTQMAISHTTDISNPSNNSRAANKPVVKENPWFPKLDDRTKIGCSENYVPKGERSSQPHQPVTAAQETQKPTIVTSKTPFDSFCRRSPTPPMSTSRSPVADRKDRIPEKPNVHRPSDLRTGPMSKSFLNIVSDSVTDSAKSAPSKSSRSRSPQSDRRNKHTSSPGTGTCSTSSSARTECVPPRQASAGRTDTQQNVSSGRGDKKEQKKKRKRKNNTRRAEDVDNYVGDKPIEELLKFIEG